MKNSRIKISLVITGLILLLLLGVSPIVVFGQSQTGTVNWVGPDGNYPNNWDYVAQNQLNSGNVQNLQVSWIYPIAPAPAAYGGTTGNDIVITPVVVDGISYVITDYHLLIAQDLKDGTIVWQQELPIQNFTGLETLWDSDYGNVAGNITGHYHGLWYSSHILGQPLIWLETNNNTLYAYNALTGDFVLKIPTILPYQNIPGNFGLYGTQSRSVLIDDQRDIVLVGSGGTESDAMGRGFFEAYYVNSTTPTLLWRSFIIPPQDGSDPNWGISSVQNMSYAYMFNGTAAINLKTLPNSTLEQMLYGDWGNFGYNGTYSYAGADTGWGGSWALDESAGVAYVGTEQPGADWNASTRPGPDLWSDSVMAINMTSGKFIWAFQTTSHDTWDFDCSWSVMLANATINGQLQSVVYKGCKNGYFYALSAKTGALLWYFNPPNIRRTADTYLFNPMNETQMKQPWANYPSTATFLQNPSSSGGFESDPAYNPNTNLIYVAAYNSPSWTKITPLMGPGIAYSAGGTSTSVTGPTEVDNTTIYALNADTGQIAWSYYIPNIGYRGGITTTSDIVIVPRQDGYLDFLNAKTGALITEKYIGAALITEPAIATDANNQMTLVMPASNSASGTGTVIGAGIPANAPGFMFAMSTSTASNNQTGSSATTTATTTITLSQSGSVQGVSSTLFDGVVALAVVFGVAALGIGVFATRRKKPNV
jgi:outer membrane protein assembly factor BamB